MSINFLLRGPMMILGIIGLFFSWDGNWFIGIALVLYVLEHVFALFSPHSFTKVVLISLVIPFVVGGTVFSNWGAGDIAALILSVATIIHTLNEIRKMKQDPVAYQQKIMQRIANKQSQTLKAK